MAEVRFTREEIEAVMKEKFKITKMEWDGDDLLVDMKVEDLEEHEEEKEVETPQEDLYENLSDIGQDNSNEEEKTE